MDMKKMIAMNPIISDMVDGKEVFWINPKSGSKGNIPFSIADIEDAQC